MRSLGEQDPDVLLALSRQRDEEAARERKRRRVIADANAQTLNAAKLRLSIEDATATSKRRRAECMDAERILEIHHAMKNLTLEDLGHGRISGAGGAGRKQRFDVLGRLSRLGQGLSGAQRNEFGWLKRHGTRICSRSMRRTGLASSRNGSSA